MMAECTDLLASEYSHEEIFSKKSSSKEDASFDQTIGHIQDILLSEQFTDVQQSFMEQHYHHFEDIDENKFIYTDIFREYTELVERHLELELKARMPDFVMEKFMKTLESHKDEVGEEILDMLLSFTDFLTFKQMFIDYKAEKEGTAPDLGGFIITSFCNDTR